MHTSNAVINAFISAIESRQVSDKIDYVNFVNKNESKFETKIIVLGSDLLIIT